MSATSIARSSLQRPDEAIVFHWLKLITAEAIRDAEVSIRSAKGILGDIERLAEEASTLQADSRPVESMSGPRAARLLPGTEQIASASAVLWRVFDQLHQRSEDAAVAPIVPNDFPALVRLREFSAWLQTYRDQLAAKVKAFGEQFEIDLQADADRQREIAADWSVVAGDGVK
jgi:hypothetical protein